VANPLALHRIFAHHLRCRRPADFALRQANRYFGWSCADSWAGACSWDADVAPCAWASKHTAIPRPPTVRHLLQRLS
jgi:hypothetical protein